MPEIGELREGDWQCPNPACINHTNFPQNFVYSTKVNCPKCGTGKYAQRPGDWCCPNTACVNHRNTVYGSKTHCSKCGHPKPGPGGSVAGVVPAGYSVVMGVPAPAVAAAPGGVERRHGDWHCPNPECKNHTENFVYACKNQCPLCGTPKPAAASMPPSPAPHMVHHPQMVPHHAMVQQYMPQPVHHQPATPHQPPPPPGPGPRGPRSNFPGDWHCPNPECKNHRDNVVYGSKTICPLCHTPKGDHPGMVPEQNPPQQQHGQKGGRPGDWQCPNPSCKNHTNLVYGSKDVCNLCGARKPSASFKLTNTQDLARDRSRSPMGSNFPGFPSG